MLLTICVPLVYGSVVNALIGCQLCSGFEEEFFRRSPAGSRPTEHAILLGCGWYGKQQRIDAFPTQGALAGNSSKYRNWYTGYNLLRAFQILNCMSVETVQ